ATIGRRQTGGRQRQSCDHGAAPQRRRYERHPRGPPSSHPDHDRRAGAGVQGGNTLRDNAVMATASTPVWRLPGMPALLTMTFLGFSGFSALMPVAPLWAAEGGAASIGVGAVNGVLMLFTVLTQPFVPSLLRTWGWGPVMATGLLLLGLPSLAHLASDALPLTLALAAVRGLGFGVLTVTGSAAVANLVAPRRQGAAVGVYGLGIAVPQVLLMPAGPWLVELVGFWVVFTLGALPVLGSIPAWVAGRAIIV